MTFRTVIHYACRCYAQPNLFCASISRPVRCKRTTGYTGQKKFCKIAKKEQKALTCRKKYVIIYERRKWISMEKYPRGRRGSPAKGVAWAIVARVQISSSPPQGVAFEHAALLLLSERCCRYRFSNKAVWNKAFRPLSYAETRYPRQLHKINQ